MSHLADLATLRVAVSLESLSKVLLLLVCLCPLTDGL